MRGRGRHPHTGCVTPRGPIQGAQDPVTRRETVSSIADSSPATRCPLPARQCELRIAVAGSRTRVADPGTHVADPGSGVATANGVGGGNAERTAGQPRLPARDHGEGRRPSGSAPGAAWDDRAVPGEAAIPGFGAVPGPACRTACPDWSSSGPRPGRHYASPRWLSQDVLRCCPMVGWCPHHREASTNAVVRPDCCPPITPANAVGG
jgi:hypothetical protein